MKARLWIAAILYVVLCWRVMNAVWEWGLTNNVLLSELVPKGPHVDTPGEDTPVETDISSCPQTDMAHSCSVTIASDQTPIGQPMYLGSPVTVLWNTGSIGAHTIDHNFFK